MAHVTIPDENSWISYTATSGQTDFTFAFSAFAKTDLIVSQNGTDLTQSDWTIAWDTSASGGYTGGTITLNTGATAGDTVIIRRDIAAVRTSDFGAGALSYPALNTEFDTIVARQQDFQRDLGRTILFPLGEGTQQLGAAASRANTALAFDGSGNIEYISQTDLTALGARTSAIDALSTTARLNALDTIYTDLSGADTIGDAAALLAVTSPGIVSKNTSGVPVSRTITGGTGISVSNGDGGAGNPGLALHQRLQNIANIADQADLFYVNNGSAVVGKKGDTALAALGGGTTGIAVFKGASADAIRSTLQLGSAAVASLLDEDDMGSNRSDAAASQQSTKAYVDAIAGTVADINAITPGADMFIKNNGANWVGVSGADAREALGLTINAQVQGYSAYLASIAGITPAANVMLFGNGEGAWVALGGSAARGALGLGSMATQNAGSVSVVDAAASGSLTLQTKFIVVKSAGAGSDSLAAIHAARDAVGVGGTIMLAGGQDYEVSGNIAMNVAGQTLHIPSGASITHQTPATGGSIQVTADDCTVCGSGEIEHMSINVGSYSTVGEGEGFRLLGHGFTIKNPLSRAVNVVDVYGDKPIELSGTRVYWTTAGVAVSKTLLPLVFNIESDDAASNGENVIISDCEVDYTAWTQEDIAEILYPASSGNPNTIGFRVAANDETTFSRLRIENCRGRMPLATQGSPSWDPVTYGNAADTVGQRRPTLFEITADRSDLNYTGKSGTFTAAETVTGGTSGATCVVGSDSTNSMKMYSRSGSFEPGETLTGGTSGATATFVSIQGGVRDFVFHNNKAIGGDLGFSFGNCDKVLFVGNYADGQTSYPLENATGHIITGAGNHFGGRQAGKAVSCTNTVIVNLPGSYVECGANTGFGDANTGVTFEGVGRLNMSGSTFKAGADSISMVKVRSSVTNPVINLTGCTFLGEEFSTLKAVHVDQGTVDSLILSGCVFRDIDTNSLVIDSGNTVTNLVTTGNVGVNAGAYSNSGTVTNHINNNNLGISGLDGASSYDESNVAITGGTIDGITGTNLDINSGSIDGTAIGSSSRSTGYFSEIGIGVSGSVYGDFELVSSGHAQMKLHSNFANSTATGFYIDTSGDGSFGKLIFQKDGVSRGVFSYAHAASGSNEKFSINVAGGSDKFTVEGSGHIGLGNTSPAYHCDVGGDANVTGAYRVGATTVIDSDRVFALPSYTVATAPSASAKGAGALIYVTDGDAGADCLAQSDGTNWMRIAHGAAISAT